MLDTFAQFYVGLTKQLVHELGITDSEMHVHAGLMLYLTGQFLFRNRRGSIQALKLVFIAELANETLDFIAYDSLRLADTIQDVLFTFFWPTCIYVMSVYRRRRWATDLRRRELRIRSNPLRVLRRAAPAA